MTSHSLRFVELTDRERQRARPLAKGDQIEVHIRRKSGEDQTLSLPAKAEAFLQDALSHLLEGERLAILAVEQEVSPNDAASILGISRPLVVHRMEIGDLPFRYAGKHRRAALKDVLALKAKIDLQKSALDALAENTEALMRDHGL